MPDRADDGQLHVVHRAAARGRDPGFAPAKLVGAVLVGAVLVAVGLFVPAAGAVAIMRVRAR